MRKQKRIPYESCIIIYFFLQLIYVYAKGTCVSVSDEYTYKQIAMDIFQGEAVSSFHYPFVYPFILSLSFYFADAFYNVMLFENILLNPDSVKKLLFHHDTNVGIHRQKIVQSMDFG